MARQLDANKILLYWARLRVEVTSHFHHKEITPGSWYSYFSLYLSAIDVFRAAQMNHTKGGEQTSSIKLD